MGRSGSTVHGWFEVIHGGGTAAHRAPPCHRRPVAGLSQSILNDAWAGR